MAISTRIREHLRHNVVGYIALFCFAIGGAAQALPGKNQVDSGDIKKAQVKNSDLANSAVIESKLADGAVTNPKLAQDAVDGSKVADNSLKGADVDEASLNIPQQSIPTSLPPSGAAGGDLSGTYPDPQVKESGLIPGGDLSGTLASAQVSEAGLTAAGDIDGALNATAIDIDTIGALEPGVANDEITDGGVDTEDVQNNNLSSTDIAADSLTSGDISNNDTIDDQELDDETRSIPIPASELNAASVAGEAPTNDAEFGFTPTSKAAAVTFDPNTLEAVNLVTEVPGDRVTGTNMSVRVHWDSTVAGVVDWRVDAFSRGNFDPSNVAPPPGIASLDIYGNANTVHNFSLNIPAANITSGGMLYIRVVRVANSAQDTLAADANVHLFEIEYSAER